MVYRKLPANTPTILRNAGLTVVETDGWYGRGRPSSTGELDPRGVLCHHTATGPRTSNAAVVKLLINGRSDLPGPLCHFGLARNGTVYIIAAGRANHAGKAKASGNMPAGDGNKLYWGIEAFNDGRGEPWSQAQKTAYALLCAVLSVKFTKNSSASVRAHKETSVTGKIDPTFPMPQFRADVEKKMQALTAVKPSTPSLTGPKPPQQAPPRWSKFAHLDPAKYMDYYKAIQQTARGGAVDVDVQKSKTGTAWGLHWPTVGKNHLSDPKKQISGTTRIDALTDAQIDRLRSAAGKKPHKMVELLKLANDRGVRIEMELKVPFPAAYVKSFMATPHIAAMNKAGRLQVKTLAKLAGPSDRLAEFQRYGAVTLLSFTGYTGAGIPKQYAWPVTDYYRGTPKWR